MVHVGPALKFTLIGLVGGMCPSWSIWMTQMCWRSGMLSSCNSTSECVNVLCVCGCVMCVCAVCVVCVTSC